MNKVLRLLIVFLCIISTNVFSGRQEGWDAYDKGDYQTAYKEFKPLAESGDAYMQFTLGWMYDNGKGVLQDYKEAVKWYTLAAEQGYASAQFNLALKYDDGEGVLQDD
ncbi:MAG: sel1 repeat family protein, partial [Flavobacteriia bacterium]|nr:sel1 repeat family protein [Flavobacteriia bacterium]